jgi:hypothetical protein
MQDANYWIQKLNLIKHPEGGYYKELYESPELVPAHSLPSRYKGNRPFATSIYFLVTHDNFSSFHRLLSDEIWFFHFGAPLNLHIITPGGRYIPVKLGCNIEAGETFQYVVTRGSWMAASVDEAYTFSLAGTVVAPGFRFDDFTLATHHMLIKQFPHLEDVVNKFTRT